MSYKWRTCPTEIKNFISHIHKEITKIINDDLVGFYLHGSLAMGGFNPDSSDLDLLAVTNQSLTVQKKRELAAFFLKTSNSPYPIEISYLNREQLKNWQHPCPFDFHYSEFWRERYVNDLLKGTYEFLNEEINTDPDLAAHFTILNKRGICVAGEPIVDVFPTVPRSDYISSIMGDFKDCLRCIEEDPVYCVLNVIRVYWYLKEGVISSKEEAGNWGLVTLPQEFNTTVSKVVGSYTSQNDAYEFTDEELIRLRDYIADCVEGLLV
ncbi:DUF4111 domain-containing protein [Rossellomorea aquimaris]|uniref:aminoglycoside adenylyltransferase domain-containing protein n=1 Tax=Rossellomorea aquimaris TaxID=189382 RepID=UPI001CD59FE1|nr:aminoglycoside adenylyltransferase domain-containing protein [Rossellomorea aquimaris]MCA1054236.1 DUF4111 domain-containing protein [Rossellomorea aquimaris]